MTNWSDSQKRAQKNYDNKNKEQRTYQKARSSARSFIRNHANEDDLSELEKLIVERRKHLERRD